MYERPTVAVNQKSTTLVLGHSDGFAQCSPGLHLCWCTCSIHRLPGEKSDRQSERERERERTGGARKGGRIQASKEGSGFIAHRQTLQGRDHLGDETWSFGFWWHENSQSSHE
ncbi:hypothetical protein KC19_5G174000 [Ceratodon purpureus]|uniref:Uncharacterized protein n=1 Tax=Ceratodon purpureus TaxID=3225 RepID=A0A8T0I2L0_CERPU|nr:hypothetical protein KC19_5G174000 [Ceratodon purpureus]